ncbi:hypothetical protein KNV09_gp085 [Vibrio phage Athena]|uniref:Uncharacterized protein n=8 Tax=Thalassavirus TaxID=2948922 RepID=A0A6M4ES62_9CAUD|nr:hypothetical protein KNU52_gp082 [Vibrio phage Achelous]YP_010102516.1 hypothetical protein KNU58_gp076 [Vibrio phage Brizo]YP_010105678.1 hypothetical protein KNU87_gp085 [Vibrio phage Bennett]YP_010105873.1 hypothetical protein KNU88_gp087 [Vibrio phage Chester]YP_010108322.1 hypothetical protein KNV07_gp086 [Vibrio phage Cody]YP_010108515.1 hypothetical protein KNV08_gp087 [Vibrio phage Quinn]YP_010108710.1 hypothetical protein KNV09_gp085 [Vibrio phage Athena]YP_010114259.1 hypothetic
MTERVVATGFEKFFVKAWKDWDGDQSFLAFYDCELDPIFAVIAGIKEVDVVEISMEDCEVRLYNSGDDGVPFFKQPYKITLVEPTN